ncbi:catalase family peroxidase [Methylophilus medardicus]|uniref:Catalase-related peroxidase n=1 Tax=Methylophilus medardicus TaxID=2588534 RepID=A0A5B8CPD7_9PROT|nr:catalase family peroxidase [Methylophilus medardicus]QDC43108.1 catalase family peroxidase [Methylophilus medardicus]QDC48115.1 catalase family peroxidase [Methylophilus medardicus]QDC51820.1 catalase family peroxidase [Methylophilus medardicus]
MQLRAIIAVIFAGSLTMTHPVLAEDKPVTEQVVDTLTTLSGGPHAGYRANHAKGIMVEGSFTPSAQAASISQAVHFQKPTPVLVRFSDATGVPNIPDANGNAFPKGIAIRFQLPDGTATDIVSISVNGFPAATPEDFLGLLNAVRDSQASTAKPSPVEQFLGTHPAALKFVSTPKPAPESFATQPFFGVNAFQFSNAGGKKVYGRYQIVPVSGARYLTQQAADKAAPDYLMKEIVERVQTKGVQYKLLLQLAEQGDDVNNATVVWPDSRQLVELGTLTLNKAVADSQTAEKPIMFNPLQLTEGIAPSQDPILLARPAAYAVSFGRRLAK